MAVILLISDNSILRARDGQNFAEIACLAGAAVTNTDDQAFGMATMGPGADASAPGTHFYFVDFSGNKIGRCNGDPFTYVAGAGLPAFTKIWGLSYVQAADRLYVAYYRNPADPGFRAAYFDFAETWTVLPATFSLSPDAGALGFIPSGSEAGQLIVGWANDSRFPGTRNMIQRYNGAAWVDELILPIQTNTLQLLPWGTATVACLASLNPTPGLHWPLVRLRSANGVWTDITEPGWGGVNDGELRAACAAVFDDDLYVAYYQESGARSEIWKRTAAGVWSLEYDLVAQGVAAFNFPTALTVIEDQLYCALTDGTVGYYLGKPLGGAWAQLPLTNLAGVSGFYTGFFASVEGTITPTEGNCSGEYVTPVQIRGFWDAQAFVAWPAPQIWTQAQGLWNHGGGVIGTQVWMGTGIAQYAELGGLGSVYTVGEIDVIDSFVLNGRPPNGKGLVNVSISNVLALTPPFTTAADYPLYLVNAFEYICPAIDSVDPATGDIDGGYTVTLHGSHFFSNLINPSHPANSARVVNRIWVRNGLGTRARPYIVVEVPYRSITVVDAETVTFPMASFPGGFDPDVELLFQPAGLAPFGVGEPYGIFPTYRCPRLDETFAYTGFGDFAIIGSLETVLGLGGTGGDVNGPGVPGAGGGGGGGQPRCPDDVTAGPCVR